MPVAIWREDYEPPNVPQAFTTNTREWLRARVQHATTFRTVLLHTLDLTMILFLVWLALDTPGL